MSRQSYLLLPFFLFAASAILFGNVPQVLFQSSGDSLVPFTCPRYGGGVPFIEAADGNPAPAIDFTSPYRWSYAGSTYTLPGLHAGQILHGVTDFKLLTSTSYPTISTFGNIIDSQCHFDLGRKPLPAVECRPFAGTVDITFKNQSGIIQTLNVDCPLELGVWHRSELFLTPGEDGGYDFWIDINGVTVFQDVSSEELLTDQLVGLEIGLGSSSNSHVLYDNILVELYDDCAFSPSGQPVIFVRESGKPVLQSVSWESCGGPGELRIVNSGVNSALVRLNGQLVADPADFNPRVPELAFPVELPSGTNVLEVELRSKPGSSFTVEFVRTE